MQDQKTSILSNPIVEAGQSLPVMEEFLTLQGEGRHVGRSAYFIRLGGCDIGCHWCDVKESWDFDHQLQSVETLVEKVKVSKAPIVVITGGEPCIYNLDILISGLQDIGVEVNIETSGAYAVQGKPDWVCLSPKKFKEPLASVLPLTNELKIIVYNKSDFKWAEKWADLMPETTLLYLQTEWDKKDEMTPLIIDYIKDHPKWRLSVQTHKYLDIP